jgi:hypothetical protein
VAAATVATAATAAAGAETTDSQAFNCFIACPAARRAPPGIFFKPQTSKNGPQLSKKNFQKLNFAAQKPTPA